MAKAKKHSKPAHNDANKTLPIEENNERLQGETQRSEGTKRK